MSDFDGYGLALGALRGRRSWRIDRLGRLTGVSFESVWTPGENEAACRRSDGPSARQLRSLHRYYATFVSIDPEPIGDDAPHDPATCKCGFYAYYAEQDNPHHVEAETIRGVIEGYGKVTLGPKGFRAQKAKIVALCVPASALTDKDLAYRPALLNILWGAVLVALNGFAVQASALAVVGLIASLAVLARGLYRLIDTRVAHHYAGEKCQFRHLHRSDESCCPFPWPYTKRCQRVKRARLAAAVRLDDALIEKVRRNYPDVAFFDSEKAMLAAFPVEVNPLPELTPETVEDFWTREATA